MRVSVRAVRADGSATVGRGELPVRWLLAEWPATEPEPVQFWLSGLPADTPLATLVRTAKLRWRIEHDYRERKQALASPTSKAAPGGAGTTTSPSSPSHTPSAPSSASPAPQERRRRPEPLPSCPRTAVTPRTLDRRLPHLSPHHALGVWAVYDVHRSACRTRWRGPGRCARARSRGGRSGRRPRCARDHDPGPPRARTSARVSTPGRWFVPRAAGVLDPPCGAPDRNADCHGSTAAGYPASHSLLRGLR